MLFSDNVCIVHPLFKFCICKEASDFEWRIRLVVVCTDELLVISVLGDILLYFLYTIFLF